MKLHEKDECLSLRKTFRVAQYSLAFLLCGTLSAYASPKYSMTQPDTRQADEVMQTIRVTGKVVDESGVAVIGANVSVKGTTNGAITDVNGDFTLQVPMNSTLSVSYIGYLTQEVKVTGSQPLRIVIKEDAQNLEELVVIGYGTMKKKDLMGATTGVAGDNLSTNSNISTQTSPWEEPCRARCPVSPS